MDNFSTSYIAFFCFVLFCFCFFFNAGPMLIAVFITEMVVLHKCFYYYYYYCYIGKTGRNLNTRLTEDKEHQ